MNTTMAPCAICERLLTPDDIAECASCREFRCNNLLGNDGCPSYACACACISEDQDMQELRTRLREAAKKRAQLILQSSRNDEEQARLRMLHEVTESLREEINRTLYPEDFED